MSRKFDGDVFTDQDYTEGILRATGSSINLESTVLESGEAITMMRTKLPTDTEIIVSNGNITDANGDAPNHLEVEVFNHTTQTTEFVVDSDTLQRGFPLYQGSSGDEIEIRVVNATDNQKSVQANMGFNYIN